MPICLTALWVLPSTVWADSTIELNVTLQWNGSNIGDGSSVAGNIGNVSEIVNSAANYPLMPNGMALNGALSIGTVPYGSQNLGVGLSVITGPSTTAFNRAAGASGILASSLSPVASLSQITQFDSVTLFDQVISGPPPIQVTVSSWTGSETHNTSAATATGATLHFAAGVIPGYIISGVGVTGTNIPVGTTVASVNSTANTVTLNQNVTGTGVAAGAAIQFGVGRATLSSPLTSAQRAQMQQFMWLMSNSSPAWGSYVTGWDASAGTWIECVGWTQLGSHNSNFNQVPSLPSGTALYVGITTGHFARNTVVTANPGDPFNAIWTGDEIDVVNNTGTDLNNSYGINIIGMGSNLNYAGMTVGGNFSVGEDIQQFGTAGVQITDGSSSNGYDLLIETKTAYPIFVQNISSGGVVYQVDASGSTYQTGGAIVGGTLQINESNPLLAIGRNSGGGSWSDSIYFWTQGGGGQQAAIVVSGGTAGGNNGNIAVYAAKMSMNAGLALQQQIVANLPTCNSAEDGTLFEVIDASSPTWNGPLTGGGSSHVMAMCNGTSWTAH